MANAGIKLVFELGADERGQLLQWRRLGLLLHVRHALEAVARRPHPENVEGRVKTVSRADEETLRGVIVGKLEPETDEFVRADSGVGSG